MANRQVVTCLLTTRHMANLQVVTCLLTTRHMAKPPDGPGRVADAHGILRPIEVPALESVWWDGTKGTVFFRSQKLRASFQASNAFDFL